MINSIAFTLLVFGTLIFYKRSKKNKKRFHAPPTNQLPSWRLNPVFVFSKRVVSSIQMRTTAIDKSNSPKTTWLGGNNISEILKLSISFAYENFKG